MSAQKEYGLILHDKQKPKIGLIVKKPSVFDDESDSESSESKPTGFPQKIKRQDRIVQQKAVTEDPTIFQYDELYDEMDQKRKESKLSRKDLDKKPKYIGKLMIAAEKRKLENERRIERQVQREREAEGNEFKDKESFVTSAYKKKLEEMKEQEELEKREEYLESIGDVTRQGNLDGFYRHLYEQKVNYNDKKEKKMEEIKTKVESKEEETEKPEEESEKLEEETEKLEESTSTVKPKRQYRRKRTTSAKSDASSESEAEEKSETHKGQVHLMSNLDADSDFSIDSSDSETEGEPKEKKIKQEEKEGTEKLIDKTEEAPQSVTKEVETIEEKPQKPKIDIWKKRTVGEAFISAVERYQKRKELRSLL